MLLLLQSTCILSVVYLNFNADLSALVLPACFHCFHCFVKLDIIDDFKIKLETTLATI